MVNLDLKSGDDPVQQIKECVSFRDSLDKEIRAGKTNLNIDMRDVKWILPCSALLLGQKMFELSKKGIATKFIQPADEKVSSYLSAIGFPFGNRELGNTFVPVSHFAKESMESVEKEVGPAYDIIEKFFPRYLHQEACFLISELTDNIDQHSKFSHGSIMLQIYKRKGYVDIGVLDDGLTIPGLYKEHGISFEDDCDSLEKALRGVSTKNEPGRGKGLSSTKKLVMSGLKGEIHVISGKGLVKFDEKGKLSRFLLPSPLKGTLVYLRFKIPEKSLNIYDYIS